MQAPMSDRCREHLGDFVAISPENVVIVRKNLNMIGQHGGATPAEMEIPLIVASDTKPLTSSTYTDERKDRPIRSARL